MDLMPDYSHATAVKKIQQQVASFYKQKKQAKIYRGSTNSLRKQEFKQGEVIDISQLSNILHLDSQQRFVETEPNVPMDQLVEHTLQHGFIPAVVMEFPGITVGGGVQGGAAESSSFKYGLFHDTCLEYEIVLGNGEVVAASKQQNSELFREIVCTYGTLGVLTKIKLKLVPASKYVRLTYHTVDSFEEAKEVLLTKSKATQTTDFVDGIMFSKQRGVIMVGKLSDGEDSIGLPKKTFHRARDEWFSIHAENIARRGKPYEELIPIKDYLFRYDRGAFWMARYGFSFLHLPFNRLTRFLTNSFCSTRQLYHALHSTNLSQRYFVQDLCLPAKNTVSFMEFVDQEIGAYPLWLLPLNTKLSTASAFVPIQGMNWAIDIGVWCEVKSYEKFLDLNRSTETKVHQLGGVKTLYAHAYYTKEEFWSIYDKDAYNKARKKYYATRTFPNIYDKVVVKERYKPSLKTAFRHYLRSKLPLSK